jgi:FAD/FMN-containing dehydrogenase
MMPLASENWTSRLAAIVGDRHVLVSETDVEPFYRDWIGRMRGQAICVVRPQSTAEVGEIVRLCAERGEPVFPQGGNTGVCDGSVPLPGGRGVLVSLSRMNRVRSVDLPNNSMSVDAGVILADAQSAAANAGRLFPLTLGSEGSCQIGGNVSTNAGGTSVLRYGNMRDLVLGLEVVLADGSVWDGLRSLRKDNTGYDMKSIFIGSEGTLGVVTGASLKLFPQSRSVATALVAVREPEAAAALLTQCQARFDADLVAFELMSRKQVELVLRHIPGTRDPLSEAHCWYVLIELTSPQDNANLPEMLEVSLESARESGWALNATVARNQRQREEIWRIRHSVSEANRAHGLNFTHDVAVPISRIPEFLHRCDIETAKRFPEAESFVVGHMGDGNMHYTVTLPRESAAAAGDPIAIGGRVTPMIHDIAVSLGGSFGAEHGIGRRYQASLLRYKSPVELAMFRQLKRAFDPAGIMNPGKILPLSRSETHVGTC